MKVCMVGLGSIGKRHFRNLSEELKRRGITAQIDALRHDMAAESEEQLPVQQIYYDGMKLPDDYDVIFITNPTVYHYDTILQLAGKTKHMFIEKPLFADTNRSLSDIPLSGQGVYYVACPLRHTKLIKWVREWSRKNQIISIRAISSSYLPDWRKGIDYRTIYSANKKLGGGVSLDLIHEWDYICYLFGMPQKLVQLKGHFSQLEMDAEDVAVYIAQYEDKLAEVHLDYFGRKKRRVLELFTNHSTLICDFIENKIVITDGESNVEQCFEADDFYKTEMAYFLDCIEGKAVNMNTPRDAFEVLRLVCQ